KADAAIAAVARTHIDLRLIEELHGGLNNIVSSYPGLSRPSTSYRSFTFKSWMPATGAGMTNVNGRRLTPSTHPPAPWRGPAYRSRNAPWRPARRSPGSLFPAG